MHTPDQSRLPLRTQQERSIPGVCLLPGLISKALRSPASPSDPLLGRGGGAKPTFSEWGPQAWGEKNAAFEFHGRREVVDISDPMSLENYQSQKDSIQLFLSRHTPLGHVLQAGLAFTTADTECGKDGNGRRTVRKAPPGVRPRGSRPLRPPLRPPRLRPPARGPSRAD